MTITITASTGETVVSASAAGQYYPSVAPLSGGGYVITWTGDIGGGVLKTLSQIYSAGGVKVGGEIVVGSGTNTDPASVASGPNGGFIVVWGGGYQLFDSAGAKVGAVGTLGSGYGAVAAPLAGGQTLVAWTTSQAQIFAQRVDASGAAAGSAFRIDTLNSTQSHSYSASSPSIMPTPDGGYLVMWDEDGDVRAQRFDSNDARVGAESVINDFTINSQGAAHAVMLTGGGYVMTWQSMYQDGSNFGIIAQRFTAAGVKVGGEFQVNTTTIDNQIDPKITALPDGGFYVIWETKSQATYPSQLDIVGQRFSSAGVKIGAETPINTTTALDQLNTGLITLTNGAYVAVWQSGGTSYEGGPPVVYQSLVAPSVATPNLSAMIETATGDGANDTFIAAPGTINAGDVINGAGGTDAIQLTAAATYNFTGATLSSIELIRGSTGNDRIVFNGAAPTGVAFDSGGGADTLVLSGIFDLTSSMTGTWTVTAGGDSTFRISDYSWLSRIQGEAAYLRVTSSSLDFNAEQRAGLFANGVDEVRSANNLMLSATGLAYVGHEVLAASNARDQYPALSRGGYAASNALSPTTVGLAGGDYLVSWVSAGPLTYGVVFAQRFTAGGSKVGGVVQLTPSNEQVQSTSLLALPNGGYVLSWGGGIKMQVFDGDGAPVGAQFSRTGYGIGEPTMTALPGGGFVLLYTGNSDDIVGQKFDASGAAVGGEFLVNTSTDYSQIGPAAATTATGFVVVWETGGDLFGQRFDASGAKAGGQFAVNTTTDSNQQVAAITALTDGGFVVAWESVVVNQGLGKYDIFAQRFDASGVKVGAEFRVNTVTNEHQNSPSIVATEDGGFIIAWTSNGLDGTTFGVFTQRFDASGARVGPETQIEENSAGDQTAPSLTALAQGGYAISWLSNADRSGSGQASVNTRPYDTVDYHVLSSGTDTINGTAKLTLVVAAPSQLAAGDVVLGGGGNNYFELNSSGVLDLTAATNFGGFQNIHLASGDDELVTTAQRLAGLTYLHGSTGSDTLRLAAAGTLDLSAATVISMEHLQGSGGDDLMILKMSAITGLQTVDGGAGEDTVQLAAAATLNFVSGSVAFSGVEHLIGSSGNDAFVLGAVAPAGLVSIDGGAGIDVVVSAASYYLWPNVENLILTAGFGSLFGVGNDLANAVTGNEGDNLLIGWDGADTLNGGAGSDALFGVNGDDALSGQAGIDYLVGGDGVDALDGGADPDALYGEDGADVLIGGTGFFTDILVGGNGNDILRGDSGLGDYDLIDGGAGDDSYYVDTPDDLTFEAVGGGVDTVFASITGAGYYLWANTENLVLAGNTPFGVGNELDNVITGSNLVNWLLGGAGNDTLNGKAGNDVLFGQAGSDTFVFEAGTGGDVIGDFQVSVDKIELDGLYGSFAEVQAHLVDNGGTTALYLNQTDFIVLNGVAASTLTAADFVFKAAAQAEITGWAYEDEGKIHPVSELVALSPLAEDEAAKLALLGYVSEPAGFTA